MARSTDEARNKRGRGLAKGALGGALLLGGLRVGRAKGLLLAAGGASLLARGLAERRDLPGEGRLQRKLLARPRRVEVRRAITIGRSPEEVYRYFHRIEEVERTLDRVSELRRLADGGVRFIFPEALTELEWIAEVVEDVPNERIAFRGRPGSELDCEGSIELRPAPGDRGTEVRLQLRCEPPGGKPVLALEPLLRWIGKYQLGHELARMKELIETGEIATAAMRGEEPAITAAQGREEVHA
jgi:uncharacterized membrane protein